MSHWDPALRSLTETTGELYGPKSFIEYLRDTGQDPNQYRTAAELSIDTRLQLSNRLAEQDTMVLRLGRASDGPGTQFALVRVPGRLDDFFIDEEAFEPADRQVLDYTSGGDDALTLGQSARDMLEVYRSLPTFSETSFVNFEAAQPCDEPTRWDDLPAAMPVHTEPGMSFLERQWAETCRAFVDGVERICAALETHSTRDLMRGVDQVRQAFHDVGATEGPTIYLYDEYGLGIRHRDRLDAVLKRRESDETVWIVPAAVRY